MSRYDRYQSLVELLGHRANEQPERTAYVFLLENGREERCSYGELDAQARGVAANLQQSQHVGERALLLFPPGLDYLYAFFGCLYAGVLPVPAYPPRSNGHFTRLQAIVTDADATVALTTPAILQEVQSRLSDLPALAGLNWMAPTREAAHALHSQWQPVPVERESLAFLQYTSGSTALPKGVMLTHGNLMHNLHLMETKFGTTPDSRCVIWLPPYHDMGLIGGILQPLYTGYPVTLMAPVDFIQKPLRWLELISKTGATISGGPNFAYDLCVQKIGPTQREALDLSSWEVAFSGAEPVRAATLSRFTQAFAPSGFRESAFFPCYGLAEGTLFAAGGHKAIGPVVRSFDADSLLENQAVVATEPKEHDRVLVSSGRAKESGQRLAIVDPLSGRSCSDGQVGEIWVSGPSIAKGYWKREEQTADVFGAKLQGDRVGQDTFLKTGDLGFVLDGELYVTGRMKDLLILRGRNYYPQDLEQTVQQSHPAVQNSNGAAVGIEVDGEERLVIVQEVERSHRRSNLSEVAELIRKQISLEHSLQAHAIVLLRPMSIPKTTSGKVQRHACREQFMNGTLEELFSDVPFAGDEIAMKKSAEPSLHSVNMSREALLALNDSERQGALEQLLAQLTAAVMRLPLERVQTADGLDVLGLDSLMAAEIKQEVEERWGVSLPFSRLLSGPTLEELAVEIGGQLATCEASLSRQEAAEERLSGDVALTDGQRALWLMQRLEPQSAAYQIAKAVRVRQELDVEALRVSFRALSKRHPLLRAALEMRDGTPVLFVHEEPLWDVVLEDVAVQEETELHRRLQTAALLPIASEGEALVRVHLFQKSKHEFVLLLVMHHIICDFWSLGLLLQELTALYGAVRAGTQADLPSPPRSFASFAIEQKRRLDGARRAELDRFWKQQLGDDLPVLDLPTDYPRSPVQTFGGRTYTFALPEADSGRLKDYAKSRGVTMNMLFLAAYQVLLHRYSGQETVAVGTPVSGRTGLRDAKTIGYFVNPLVQRADFDGALTFADLLAQVREGVTRSLEHQDLPFPLLVDLLQPKRDPAHPPLFQTLFTYQTSPLRDLPGLSGWALGLDGVEIGGGELAFESVALPQQFVQFDLALSAAESGGRFCAVFEYNTALFLPETIERMADAYQQLLDAVLEDDQLPVGALPMQSATAQADLLVIGRGPQVGLPRQAGMHERFEHQVQTAPERVALVFEDQTYTYGELNARANRLARHLQRLGVGAGAPVGVCLRRSPELVTALLAVLKAGGMYVPLDPEYPGERIAYMLADCQAAVLLTSSDLQAELPPYAGTTLCVEEQIDWMTEPEQDLPAVDRQQAAYLIYTSGSTGRPKGVVVTHHNVTHFYSGMDEQVGCAPTDALLAVTSICFDISVLELFWTLSCGAKLVLLSEQEAKGTGGGEFSLKRQAQRHGATLLQGTPSLAKLMFSDPETVQALTGLRALLLGGEALSAKQAAEVRAGLPNVRLFNMYGPTEATVWAVSMEVVDVKGRVPIGRPLANVRTYVLDDRLQPVPIGVAGELYLGGDGIAQGYFGRADLTAERFLLDPFASGGRIYKTGDAVRQLADGTLEFLGRLDHQVKVRGFRIELEEIEAVLLAHPAVQEAVCTAKESALVAYVVTGRDQELLQPELLSLLRLKLPAYMVPDHLLFLEALPLTPNGKTDKKALPAPSGDRSRSSAAYVPPATEMERLIVSVWQDVLGTAEVGVDDNFFEVGGNSLKMEQVFSRLQPQLPSVVVITDLFRYPTIRLLAQKLGESADKQQEQAVEAQGRGSARREAMQKRRGKR
ncbi:non-ribosomal peptide synthetase [Tumebacillus algifaecis]|uniref:non-ribosomal peptide synthetase n=1 Tax=Tumebacillus algifaecis TaxID=1214604 RepID=UPI0012FE70FA|nr:non-ribosomal peptide synthetase [Tumebacillus algifaecis]